MAFAHLEAVWYSLPGKLLDCIKLLFANSAALSQCQEYDHILYITTPKETYGTAYVWRSYIGRLTDRSTHESEISELLVLATGLNLHKHTS